MELFFLHNGEIAEISRVPRSRTYDVLEGLEKKGFAFEIIYGRRRIGKTELILKFCEKKENI